MNLVDKNYLKYYKNIYKMGLFDNCNEIKIHPTAGRCIRLEDINRFFFGYSEHLSNICNLDLITKKILVKFNDIPFIKLSMISKYFDYINDIVNFENDKNYIPFNYYLVTSDLYNKKMPKFYEEIYNFFINFSLYLKKKNCIEANNLINMIFNDKGYFKGYLNSKIMLNPYTMVISFNTHNNFFAIVVGEENDTILENYISFSDFNSDKTDLKYEHLYKCIVNKILLQNPEEYIINNLTNITKNKSLAEMIFKSYDKKDEYIVNIEEIESIILFKSSKFKLEYREYFKSLYINEKVYFYDNNSKNYYLNFEGFNKFLLNLNEKYLSTFKIKESINDLYYKITKELIDSYNQLFRNFNF